MMSLQKCLQTEAELSIELITAVILIVVIHIQLVLELVQNINRITNLFYKDKKLIIALLVKLLVTM